MNGQAFFDPLFCGHFCLVLLHSLWQVALLSAIVWLVDRLWRKGSVERSYALHVGALLVGLAALPITFMVVSHDVPAGAGADASETEVASTPQAIIAPDIPLSLPSGEGLEAHSQPPAVTPVGDSLPLSDAAAEQPWPAIWFRFAPWLTGIYATGVMVMLGRLLSGMLQAHQLASLARPITEGPLPEMLRNLARRWSLRVVPRLAQAERVVVPKVVGLLKPTILLPAAALAGLSTGELEMILTHELAHVRRHDLWVNLLQRLAEAGLFFNPALWVLSRRISALREYCCDEMTCRAVSKADTEPQLRYAAALLRIAELGASSNVISGDLASLAASGRAPSELRRRVARLFGEPLREPLCLSRGGMLAFAMLAVLLVCGPAIWQTKAQTGVNETANERYMPGDFQLHVVDSAGTPVPHASVEIRTNPAPTAE